MRCRNALCTWTKLITYAEFAKFKFEPILPNLRNLGFRELNLLVDYFPYRILPTFKNVSTRMYRKKILIDFGMNDFFGSTKALIDMYAPFFEFDEVHLFELVGGGGLEIPEYFRSKYNISIHQTFVQGGSWYGNNDVLKFLQDNTVQEDFVSLNCDLDQGSDILTMEWGFLAALLHSQVLILVDELFIKLHFWRPPSNLKFGLGSHSMLQAYEVVLQLRQCGFPIHVWP